MAKNILEIVFRTLKDGSGDRETKQALTDLQKGFKQVAAFAGAFAGVTAAVTAALKFSTAEAMEAEKMQAKLGAVLKSTGNAAGLSQKSVNDLADELSKLSGIDDELIVNSEAVMLTFTQIGRQVFPEAMKAALDMNAVLGGDLQGSVIQLGKALNVTAGDTATASMGLTAMRRSGVSFTEEQKKMALEMVKTGDVMGYQKLILEELNREFGGAAEAMGDTTAGSSEKLKNSIANLAAAIGVRFLPAIKQANKLLSENADKLTDTAEAVNDFRDAYQEAADFLGVTVSETAQATYASEQLRQAVERIADQLQRGSAMTEFYSKQVEANTQAQLENEEAVTLASDANKSMLSLIGQIQSEYEGYTEKNEELRLKLEELNAAQDMVPEWSSKYKDYQTQIEETEGEIRKLADEHEAAGKRIAFSLLQQKLAMDGLTAAEFDNLLRLGESWGIYDQTVVESALLMDEQMAKMAADMGEPEGTLRRINQEIGRIRKQNGSSFDFYVNIHTTGSVPDVILSGANRLAQSTSLTGQGEDVARAEGGPLGSGWTLTGERGPELISPSGYVMPTDVTRHLLASGMLGDVAERVSGGAIMLDGVTNVTPSTYVNFGGTGFNKPKKSGDVPPSLVSSEVTQASQAASAILPLAEATQQAAATSASVQQQTAIQTQQLVSAITVTQGEMTSLQRETNRLLGEQAKTLPRELVAAMIQANP